MFGVPPANVRSSWPNARSSPGKCSELVVKCSEFDLEHIVLAPNISPSIGWGVLSRRKWGVLSRRKWGVLSRRKWGVLSRRKWGVLSRRKWGIYTAGDSGNATSISGIFTGAVALRPALIVHPSFIHHLSTIGGIPAQFPAQSSPYSAGTPWKYPHPTVLSPAGYIGLSSSTGSPAPGYHGLPGP